jgi:hypothetical protein
MHEETTKHALIATTAGQHIACYDSLIHAAHLRCSVNMHKHNTCQRKHAFNQQCWRTQVRAQQPLTAAWLGKPDTAGKRVSRPELAARCTGVCGLCPALEVLMQRSVVVRVMLCSTGGVDV